MGPGSFNYLEAKIRRDATGTLFGRDFEWVCKWFLENAPLYRGKFRKVWRWADWPEHRGPDCGIDLVAETHDGKLWAVQAKAVAADRSITKAEIDSFLAESNRREIAYRLLIATTDGLGGNARRTIDQQAKRVSFVGRGDLLAADLVWPTSVGGTAPKPKLASPRPHQRAAIAATIRGFRKHRRGRLIMACGTGKTLTGLWIHEKLKSRRTLLLVPSISLVQQNLREWGRHARDDFDCLVVCSDESVASDRDDPALRYIAELGIDVTTDAKQIGKFLAKRRRRPAVVIATYHSSDRVSAGQKRARQSFDLALCDEAHRLVGGLDKRFATVLDDRRIQAKRRLFMTATPRYFTQRARERAADQDLELASMDDVVKFGPEFHVLKFYDAINASPPLLTDYRVVVIGVTSKEVAAWVDEGKLVRTKHGAETDARTLAAQIGLAKAIREYDLRRVITFHRSIQRAARFVDDARAESLPSIVNTLRPSSRPSGRLWARHISGETPASRRASMLRALAELPDGTRGLISNCACLGEGVDVPALDGIAFIDPKSSMVDIIQAVGRVIRLSADKQVGTILIPVFIDQTGDAEHALEQSAFDPVWQVLKALRAHDQRLADELDQLRTSIGKQPGGRVTLPANIVLDVPTLVLRDFEQAFYVRTVERVSERPPLTIEQILAWADEHKATTGEWPRTSSGQIPNTDECWINIQAALRLGLRGLPKHSSLAQCLHEHRGVRNLHSLPNLTLKQILEWADAHYQATSKWPHAHAGRIAGTDESWAIIDQALALGRRGLVGSSSLAKLLAEKRGVRHYHLRAPLTVAQILKWADQHHQKYGSWPKADATKIASTEDTWSTVNHALKKGRRGLRGGESLADLLHRKRGVVNHLAKPRLTIRQILKWADDYRATHGKWPHAKAGRINDSDENWSAINLALRVGVRGLPGGSSLARLLAKTRKRVTHLDALPLSQEQILRWADAFYASHQAWPNRQSGSIPKTADTWARIDDALKGGYRGLHAGSSLARLLVKYRNARTNISRPPLSESQITKWAIAYFQSYGKWPSQGSGSCANGQERWASIDMALRQGARGLPGGSSLAKLLNKHRRRK
jgi:superfamily II DNA or RNA helicase